MGRKALALLTASVLALAACASRAPAQALETFGAGAGGNAACNSVPAAAAGANFCIKTFETASTFNTSTVDNSATYASGFQWYKVNFFGYPAANTTNTFPGDGSIKVKSTTTFQSNTNLATGGSTGGTGWVGTAFGCGFYAEAELKFTAANVNVANGWPSWWSMAVENFAGLSGLQWTGQTAGYTHYSEDDFMEYDVANGSASYGSSIVDWYGTSTCTGGQNCRVETDQFKSLGSSANYSTYHVYGALWVPATATTNGQIAWYRDGIQVGSTVTYSQFTTQTPPPVATWNYGIIDNDHMLLLIGSGTDTGSDIQVDRVTVYQGPGACNITH